MTKTTKPLNSKPTRYGSENPLENPFSSKYLKASQRRELIRRKVIHKAWQICRGRISKATLSRTLAGKIRRPKPRIVAFLSRAIEAIGGPR